MVDPFVIKADACDMLMPCWQQEDLAVIVMSLFNYRLKYIFLLNR